jgi:drug/metabolite transporter (DMT)-like permease
MIRWLRTFDTPSRAPRFGLALAGVTAIISGVSVFVNASAVRAFDDPVVFTTLKNGVAAVVLLSLALTAARAPWSAAPRTWIGLVALGVIGGSVPFILFFTGLSEVTAPGAAVIHKTLFVWVALLAVVFLRERIGALQVAALVILLASQLLIQSPAGVGWGSGETMIAVATAFWAVEVIVAKRLLADTPAPVAAAARMGFGLLVLVGFLAVTGGLSGMGAMSTEQWAWVLGTGLLLSGYVATWYAALKRAPASAVTAVLTLGAPITAALQLMSAGQLPAPTIALGYGIGLLSALTLAWLAVRGQSRATTVTQPAVRA